MKVDSINYRQNGLRIENFYIVDKNNHYIVEIEVKFINEKTVELKNFIVRKEEYLGKGYGSFLLKETLIKLKALGFKEIVLTACASYKTKRLKQENLIAFYERNGFQKKMNKELSEIKVPMILKF